MAHFAKLDENNVVLDVNVVNNSDVGNLEFPESEALGIAFLTAWSGGYTRWRQTSYSSKFRAHYAGIGFTYDEARDAFIPPSPFPSWLLDEATLSWQAPVPYPEDGAAYYWNEATQSWQQPE